MINTEKRLQEMHDKIIESSKKIHKLGLDKVAIVDDNSNRKELKKHMREIDKAHGVLLD